MHRENKRLRGYQLEVEKQKGKRPLEKGDVEPSALATSLLSLWAHGQIPATAVQDLAQAATLDGAEHPELFALAKSGNWGLHKGSCHRDIMAYFCPQLKLCDSWEIQVPCVDPKTNKESMADASLLLPHLMFWQLGLQHPEQFQKMFGIKDLVDFWNNVEKSKDDRLHGHPICLDKRLGRNQKDCLDKRQVLDKAKEIPIFCHGDATEFQSRDSLMTWSWGGLLNALPTLDYQLLLACYPKSCTSSTTWNALQLWLKWSFQALLSGYHPDVGPSGEPLPKGSVFEEMKGCSLHPNNFRCIVWSIQGDHEFFSNVLGLNHWQNAKPCWECDCQKDSIAPPGKSMKLLEEEKQKFVEVTTPMALTKGPNHLLFQVPGVTSRMVRGDMLHILFCKGVCSHLLGSLLHHVIYHEGKGRQKRQPSDRLAIIFQEVQKHYKEVDAPVRLTNLKLSMIVDPKKPHADFPKLEAKGAETKHFCFSFLPVLQKLLDKRNEEEQSMLEALEALCLLIKWYDKHPLFLTPDQFSKSKNLAKRFFTAYAFLNKWALAKGKKLFHIVMKFHTLMHLIQNGQFINPKYTCNWKSEDFVGRVSKLGHSVAPGVRSTRLSTKIIPKYRVLLHLQMTRPGFAQHTPQED